MKPSHIACALVSVGIAVGAAFADGGFFYVEGEAVDLAQTRQEVLMAFYNDVEDATPHVTYVLRSRYAGTPTDLAWVVPVPATPTDVVAHADGGLFDRLNEGTKPRFTLAQPTSGGLLGCTCAGGLDAGGNQQTGLVEVEAYGTAGIFEWVALTSTGADALLTWLADNGFALPTTAADILDTYIQQDMHFLALRVSYPDDVANPDGEIEIPPIQFTCQTARRVYPMAISRISAAAETEVLIYVLAEHRAVAANLANALIDPNDVVYDPNSASSTNYEALFRQTIADQGGTALITEYAGDAYYLFDFDGSGWPEAPSDALNVDYLTRLRAVIAREQMDLDFEFRDAFTDAYVETFFWVSAPNDADLASVAVQPAGALLMLGLARAGISRHCRRPLRARRRAEI